MAVAKDPFKALELAEISPQAAELSRETQKAVNALIAAKKKPQGESVVRPAWYELEWLVPYRDLLFVLGFASVVAGVSRWSAPGALITAGAGLMYAGWLMSR